MDHLYRDYAIDFPTPPHVFPRHPLVIYGNFSTALAAGLMEGLNFGILTLVNGITDPEEEDRLLHTRAAFIIGNAAGLDEVFARGPKTILNRQHLLQDFGPDVYILAVSESDQAFKPGAQIYTFTHALELREFLQGFITMLDAFHINPTEGFLVAPFKGNQDYAIQGMALPVLR